jgi:hypothetical protein
MFRRGNLKSRMESESSSAVRFERFRSETARAMPILSSMSGLFEEADTAENDVDVVEIIASTDDCIHEDASQRWSARAHAAVALRPRRSPVARHLKRKNMTTKRQPRLD